MKQENQPSSNAVRIISISGLTLFLLISMLWEIISAYLQGGSDAPTVGILIAAIVVLGGGIVFALVLILRHGKQFLPRQEDNTSPEGSSDSES